MPAQLKSHYGLPVIVNARPNSMDIELKVLMLIAGAWAALKPAVFAAIFGFVFDQSALIDLAVVGSCIVLVRGALSHVPRYLWGLAFSILLVSSTVGFLHHFKDAGESGPLAYEWLNGYVQFGAPLLVLAVAGLFRNNRGHPLDGL